MLLEKEFVNKPAPEEVWLEAVDPDAVVVPDRAATTKILRSRVRRLRRMQSQNFVQRAIYSISDVLGLHKESA